MKKSEILYEIWSRLDYARYWLNKKAGEALKKIYNTAADYEDKGE